MATGNTLFILHNGDPNAWVLIRAGQDTDAYAARFDNVPDEIADALANGGHPTQVWTQLEALDGELLEMPDDDYDEPKVVITCQGMNPNPYPLPMMASPDD